MHALIRQQRLALLERAIVIFKFSSANSALKKVRTTSLSLSCHFRCRIPVNTKVLVNEIVYTDNPLTTFNPPSGICRDFLVVKDVVAPAEVVVLANTADNLKQSSTYFP